MSSRVGINAAGANEAMTDPARERAELQEQEADIYFRARGLWPTEKKHEIWADAYSRAYSRAERHTRERIAKGIRERARDVAKSQILGPPDKIPQTVADIIDWLADAVEKGEVG